MSRCLVWDLGGNDFAALCFVGEAAKGNLKVILTGEGATRSFAATAVIGAPAGCGDGLPATLEPAANSALSKI